ncbi:hypothetical protein PFHG_02393 [Plasmodium falciparum HB3]|uniref:Uncharacterized protein n=1 Tax=Plasmodium falciparum (isolate HB3) TaxID=137071 RepID=A0A0L7KB68_PLAFX|nr:hypothetical protein PFHG_02393 [Plasmodium falciparum HB3]
MEHSENIKKRYVNHSDMKLEKFKKAAYEVIEYKEKIIRMLCAILEVATNHLWIPFLIIINMNQKDIKKKHLPEKGQYEKIKN